MSTAEVIDELTDICIRQAETIKALVYALEQLGAEARAEEALRESNRLRELVGDWDA